MNTTFRIEGPVLHIGEEKVFESGYAIQDLVIEIATNSDYPQPIKLTASRSASGKWDKIAEIGEVQVGDRLRVEFELSGRENNGNYYTDLRIRDVGYIEQPPEGPGYNLTGDTGGETDEVPF